jgi:hypothetical protein
VLSLAFVVWYVIYSYSLLYYILQWLPESARYHVAAGHPELAYATLKRIADDNGKPMPFGRLVEHKETEVIFIYI